jgi:hypothetical protein
MITLFTENINALSQESYNSLILDTPIFLLTCTCGQSGCLTRHGSYHRNVKLPEIMIRLKIKRVRCKTCGATHALLPSSIIPYSQISLADHLSIIEHHNGSSGFGDFLTLSWTVDENNIASVIRRYRKFWEQRLISGDIILTPVKCLIKNCFSLFGRQFMQIKNTRNKLFLKPT